MTHFAHGRRPGPILLSPDRVAELRRLGPFLCVGFVGLAVDAGCFASAHGAGLSRPVARAASLALATLVTFCLNRRFTFAASGRQARREVLRYVAVALLVQGFSYGLFLLLAARLPNLVALVAGAVTATLFSFAGQSLFTFRSTAPDRPVTRASSP